MKQFLYFIATDRINGAGASILKGFLLFLSFLYSGIIRCILILYQIGVLKQYHLPKPVISIGNITIGGVGKTPLVIFIAKLLRDKGLQPVILTRGYMDQKGISDEASLLQRILKGVPVLIGADRINNAQEFLKNNEADVFLLDDGFQHWRLFRDLDVVAIDTTNAFGNKHVMPGGILREPLSSLRRAQSFVLTRTDLSGADAEDIQRYLSKNYPETPVTSTTHQVAGLDNLHTFETVNLEFVQGRNICSFCSIGNPESFEKTLIHLGCSLRKNFTFIDHHSYLKEELQEIVHYCQEHKIDTVVTTGKDAVKLTDFLDIFEKIHILSLRIEINITKGKNAFLERIHTVLQH